MNNNVAATIMLIARIWDIINDPMMGIICDHTHSPEGKCRYWLKRCSVPAAVIVAATFFIPDFAEPGKTIWVAVTYVAQGMISTMLLIPLNTLMGRLTSDKTERAALNQISGILGTITSLIVTGYTLKLVDIMGGGDSRIGFGYIGVIFGVIYAISFLVVYFGTRGYEPVETEEHIAAERRSIRETLSTLMSNKLWLLCMAYYFFAMFAQSLENASVAFYLQYTVQNSELMTLFSYGYNGGGFVAFLVMRLFVKRFGNSGTTFVGAVMAIAAYAIRFLLHDMNTAVMFGGWALQGLGLGLIAATITLNIFDAKVYGEWKTGANHEAVLMSGFSFSYKIGMAIGQPMAGYLLDLVPYTNGAASQPESVQNLFFYECTLIPLICIVVVLIFSIFLRRNEKNIPQMQAEIDARLAAKK